MFRTALRHPLAIFAFLIPVVVVFNTKLTAIFLIVALLGCVVTQWPPRPRLWLPLVIVIGLFLVWALLSALWSVDALHSLSRFFRLSLAVSGGVLLCAIAASRDAGNRHLVGLALAGGFFVASLISICSWFVADVVPWPAMAEYIKRMPLLSYGAIATLGVFVLGATSEKWPPHPAVLLAIVTAAVAVFYRGNSASGMALVLAFAVFAVVLLFGRKIVLALAIALPILFLSVPLLPQTVDIPTRAKDAGLMLSHSAGHRLIVWRYVYSKIQEKPMLGWGLHTSRIMPGRMEKAYGDPAYDDIFENTHLWPEARVELMPMHPHNATFQAWLELGFVGALLYAVFLFVVLLALWRMNLSRIAMASGSGLAVSIFVIGQLSFSAWQSWWLSCQFLAVAAFLYLVRKSGSAPGQPG